MLLLPLLSVYPYVLIVTYYPLHNIILTDYIYTYQYFHMEQNIQFAFFLHLIFTSVKHYFDKFTMSTLKLYINHFP